MDNSEKVKALDVAISQIEKQFGKGSVMKLVRMWPIWAWLHPHRFPFPGYSPRHRWHSEGKDNRDLRIRVFG